jgi:hypothetical protein
MAFLPFVAVVVLVLAFMAEAIAFPTIRIRHCLMQLTISSDYCYLLVIARAVAAISMFNTCLRRQDDNIDMKLTGLCSRLVRP